MKADINIIVPQESVNDQTLIVLELFFKSGDVVKKGDVIVELESSKAAIAIEAPDDGFIKYFCKEDDEVPVNGLIAVISDNVPIDADVSVSQLKVLSPSERIEVTVFSDAALELMKLANFKKEEFDGFDFVSRHDVESYSNRHFSKIETKGPTTKKVVLDDLEKIEFKKITPNKKREIEYLSSVQSSGLRSTVNIKVNLTGVSDYLHHHLKYFKNSLLPIVIYECSKLLVKYPDFNAYFNNDKIAFYKDVNVGFAVDIGKGLKVVKISDSTIKTILEIEEEILYLSNAYLDDTLKSSSMSDVTFTITDLSNEGVYSFTPLVNIRNSAILGISAMDHDNRCILTLSFDHRVTEGRQAAAFLSELKDRIVQYSSYSNQGIRSAIVDAITCYRCLKKLNEDISDVGFVKCITPAGVDNYICQSCFKGF